MKAIEVSPNEHQYPNHAVSHVDCRKRDLLIRISDWTQDRDEPAYDVEVYVGGVYAGGESETFLTKNAGVSKQTARAQAIAFARLRGLSPDTPNLFRKASCLDYYEWLASGTVTKQDLRDICTASKNRCAYCGAKVKPRLNPKDPRGFDHVISRQKGGKHEKSNIVVCCRKCNEAKG